MILGWCAFGWYAGGTHVVYAYWPEYWYGVNPLVWTDPVERARARISFSDDPSSALTWSW